MKDRVFLFDYANQIWYETHDEKYFVDDISNLPYIFTSYYKNGFTGEFWENNKVWCPVHQTFEDIADCGKNFAKTVEGCNIEGIFTQVLPRSSYFYNDSKDLYFRYRVYRDSDEKSIKVEVDAANVELSANLKPTKTEFIRLTYQVAFDNECDNLEVVPLPLEKYRDFSTQMNEDIKEALGRYAYYDCEARAVTTAVLEFLREDAVKKFDFNVPIIKSNLSNRIAAFLCRPLDSNIAGFKMYFYDNPNDFEKLFPKDSRENFSVLCRELGLIASDELRKYYEENPFAITIYMMLRRFGITKPELIQKFMTLTEFCGETFAINRRTTIDFNIFSDFIKSQTDIKNLEMKGNYKATRWENLLFYCRWYLENTSEEKLADELLRLQKIFDWKFYEAWNIFRSYFDEIPRELKNKILQSGTTVEIVDKLILFEDDKNFFVSDVNFSAEEKIFECKINGYNIRCIHSFKRFKNILQRAVQKGTHNNFNQNFKVFVVEKLGRYVDIIVLNEKKCVDKMNSTHVLYGDIFEENNVHNDTAAILSYWASHFGIDCSKYRYELKKSMFKDFIIEPIDEDKNFDNLSLLKLLQLPEEKICDGYYLILYRRFAEVELCIRSKLKHFDNEKDFLMYMFPLGERIYKAAFNGNAEAQYVLSRMYRCSFCFKHFSMERFNYWNEEAIKNGWVKS